MLFNIIMIYVVCFVVYYILSKQRVSEEFLKGNEALEKKFFFSSPRQGNMERKSKLKKKLKFLYFRPHKRLFGSAESELNGGERSVF